MATDYQEESEEAGVGDLRSTGRKWARKTYLTHLAEEQGTYACEKCGRGPDRLPYTIGQPPYGDPTWPTRIRLPVETSRVPNLALQVDHKNKDLSDVDLANLQLLCASCHKIEDSKTEKRQSKEPDTFGYATTILEHLLWPNERDVNWDNSDNVIGELIEPLDKGD